MCSCQLRCSRHCGLLTNSTLSGFWGPPDFTQESLGQESKQKEGSKIVMDQFGGILDMKRPENQLSEHQKFNCQLQNSLGLSIALQLEYTIMILFPLNASDLNTVKL